VGSSLNCVIEIPLLVSYPWSLLSISFATCVRIPFMCVSLMRNNSIHVTEILYSNLSLVHVRFPKLSVHTCPLRVKDIGINVSPHVTSTESLGGGDICSKLHALHVTHPIIAFQLFTKVVLSLQTPPPRADTESAVERNGTGS